MPRQRFDGRARAAILALTLGWLLGARAAAGQADLEWHDVAWAGGSIDVALVRPAPEDATPRPVVFALPWGSGSVQLVETFVASYWLTEPARRGYYVVAPAVRGSGLASTADEIVQAIFAWMDSELSYDRDRVALVGASNGGLGIFFAALSQPERFGALMGLPGQYRGDPADLAALAGKPIRLVAGELDDTWSEGARATAEALDSLGIPAESLIARGQGHVLRLDPRVLMDWIDRALAR